MTKPIPFSEYMQHCLFHPETGYYTQLQAIGRQGDFVTAPECGPYFADALAEYCAGQLSICKNPIIMELGAGTGRLAYDLLLGLEKRGRVPERYLICEKSESLKTVQREILAALPDALFARVEWWVAPPPQPSSTREEGRSLEGVLIANEVFDALPLERFVKTTEGLERLYVAWTPNPIEISLHEPFPWQDQVPWQTLPEGYRSEFCPGYGPFLASILPVFKKGIALIIDYGYTREDYYHPSRREGTLQAYQNHQVVSVFHEPGHCDITAHVDFTHLAECFIAQGWQIDFLQPQAQFLLAQNILERYPLSVEHYGLKRLLDPRLMGEIFKVMQCTLR